MNYDLFRTLWHEVLESADLVNLPFQPIETVELDGMSRTHEITIALSGAACQVVPEGERTTGSSAADTGSDR